VRVIHRRFANRYARYDLPFGHWLPKVALAEYQRSDLEGRPQDFPQAACEEGFRATFHQGALNIGDQSHAYSDANSAPLFADASMIAGFRRINDIAALITAAKMVNRDSTGTRLQRVEKNPTTNARNKKARL